MKISNNNNIINISKSTNFKGEIVKFPVERVAQTDTQAGSNPEYYQSVYAVKKPAAKTGEQKTDVEISEETIKAYLLDKNGNPDENLIKKFKSLYFETFQKLESARQEELAKYRLEREQSPDITPFQSENEAITNAVMNELSKPEWTSGFDFASSVLSQISGEKKIELAEKLIEIAEDEKNYIPQKAYKRTEQLFLLSRTPDGYVFTDMDRKNKILDLFDLAINQYPDDMCASVGADFIEKCMLPDGRIDLELMQDSLILMKSIPFLYSPEYITGVVKQFCEKDKENKPQIMSVMQELNYSNFAMDERRTDFEDLMSFCFDNNNKFNQEKSQIMLETVEVADEWLGEQTALLEFDTRRYNNCHEYVLESIKEYFSEITDEHGKIKTDRTPFKEYIDKKTEKLFFI